MAPHNSTNTLILNISSLPLHKQALISILDSQNSRIVLLSETNLKPSKRMNVPGFNLVRKDVSGRTGRGVAIADHNTLQYSLLPRVIQSYIEYTGISITTTKFKTIHMYSIYNSPSNGLDISLLTALLSSPHPTIICGDFNA